MTTEETQFCEVKNNEIKEFAKGFKSPMGVLETAKNIYYWVRDNIQYENYPNTRKGAYKTLKEKSGNCCDQAHLLVALLRADGIPTCYAHGTDHWWVVPCIDGKQYHCDPTNKKHDFGNPNHGNKHPKVELFNELNH